MRDSFDYANPYASPSLAAYAAEDARTSFIRKTYAHLAGAVLLFLAIETVIFTVVPPATLEHLMGAWMGTRFGWLIVLAAFMGVSYLANSWALNSTNLSTQYLGLGLYVVAESLIFVPLLYVAQRHAPTAIPAAGLVTAIIFTGLTVTAFVTRADFSWLGRYLFLAGFGAMGLVICAMLFGFGLGTWFAAAMIIFAGGYILYDTSNVMHHYRTDQHVAAALALFASVALLFWYVLRLFMSRRE